ncbi:MAG: oxidoreductase [Paenibacillaceae bacterium]|jgi:predicted dehydrogenase|nr:oxidoreductase [Paenibacillaceae bacterium]
MGERLGIGIVGCGVIGRVHALQLQRLGTARVAAFADCVGERAEAFAAEFGGKAYASYEEMLLDSEVEAVSVCTPSGMHGEMAVAAARAGKPVIVEKPMDVKLDVADRMIAACREQGVILGGIFQHRFDYATRRVKEKLAQGSFGRLVLVNGSVHWYRSDQYYASGDWRGTWAMDGGGVLMNQAIHTMDLVRYFGGPVVDVTARTANLTHPQIETEDTVAAMLRYECGAMGTFTATSSAYPGLDTRVEIIGENGTCIIENNKIVYEHYRDGEVAGTHGLDPKFSNQWKPEMETESAGMSHRVYGNAHYDQLADFVEAVRTGREPLVTGRDSRDALELVLAVYRSQETGAAVLLPLDS